MCSHIHQAICRYRAALLTCSFSHVRCYLKQKSPVHTPRPPALFRPRHIQNSAIQQKLSFCPCILHPPMMPSQILESEACAPMTSFCGTGDQNLNFLCASQTLYQQNYIPQLNSALFSNTNNFLKIFLAVVPVGKMHVTQRDRG